MTNTTTNQHERARPWVCPHCGSADIRVFYDERRVARIVNRYEDDPTPWPSPTGDELVDIDPATFTFICVGGCGAVEITPVQAVDVRREAQP